MLTKFIPLSLFLLCQLTLVFAITFPVQVRQVVRTPSLQPRANVTTQAIAKGAVPVNNFHNTQYFSNITLGGTSLSVLLDTGSSDLWVTGNIPSTRDSGVSTTIEYAIGGASGDINFATLTFDNYTVSDQAYLLVKNTSSFSTDINAQGYQGLIGLGPNSGSVISKSMKRNSSADSVLNRIFQQNLTSSNFISFLLNRNGDPKDPVTGQIAISEIIPGYENITSATKLPVQKVHKLTSIDQHWQILTDKDKSIIGPDGQIINVKSIAPQAPNGRLVAVLDSGFSLPQVPRAVSDAIYGRVQGAIYDATNELWTLPCDQYLPLSFNIGGVNFPIHPFDVVSNDFGLTGANGKPLCVGTFQPITSAFSLLGEYDLIFGMAFLRNTYTLLDYGNFVSGSSNDQGSAFVQLLPLTDAAAAKADFIATRLGGTDTTGNPNKALLPVSQMQHSPPSPGEKKKQYEEYILSRWPYIFAGCLAFVALLLGLCVWRCCRRRRNKKAKASLAAPRSSDVYGQYPTSYNMLNEPQYRTGGQV